MTISNNHNTGSRIRGSKGDSMRLCKLMLMSGSGAAVWALGFSAAFAQQQAVAAPPGPPGGAAQANATSVEEIIVTASKRQERALEVPGAITAFRGDDLLASGADSIKDFAGFTPGLQFNSVLGSGAPIIRGISTGLDTSPTVAVVVNGAPIGSSSTLTFGAQDTLDPDPIDVARVEVLKGPQGTLYGANTLGGLLSYTLRAPDLNAPDGIMRAEVDGMEHGAASYSIRGAFGTPIIKDVLAIRASGYYDRQGGFIDNTVRHISDENQDTSWGLHGSVLYQPTSRLNIDLDGFYQSVDARANDVAIYNTVTGRPRNGDLQYDEYLSPSHSKTIGVGLANVNYDLGWANLTSVTSYTDSSSQHHLNITYGGFGVLLSQVLPNLGGPAFPSPALTSEDHTVDTRKTTEEVRLTSPGDRALSWIVGGFYSYENNSYTPAGVGRTTTGAAVPTLDPALGFTFLSTQKEYSGFGNLTYKFLRVFDITGGIRVGKIDQTYRQLFYGSSAAAYNTFLSAVGAQTVPADTGTVSQSATVETYLATLRYHFSSNGILFARYATGFRPGGPNLQGIGLPLTFGPDQTTNYEAGLKTLFWHGRGSIDVTGYYTDWHNILVAIGTPSGIPGYTNGGDAVVKGAEVAASLRPVEGLTLSATLAYSDGRITRVTSLGATGLGVGSPLPDNPKWSGSLSAEYRRPLNADWTGYVSATGRFVGSRQTTPAFAVYVMPSYSLVDLHAGVQSGKYTADLFVKNLTNDRAQLAANTDSNLGEITVERPRTFGLALTARF